MMVTSHTPLINLLPWRDARQLRRRQLFLVSIAGAAVLTLLCVAGVRLRVLAAVTEREQGNASLGEQIAVLQQHVNEQDALFADLQRQQSAFARTRQLHAARIGQSRLLAELAQTRQHGVVLDELHFAPPVIQLTGSARSAQDVSPWLRLLETRAGIATAELQALYLDPQREADTRQDYFYHVRLGLRGPDTSYMAPGEEL